MTMTSSCGPTTSEERCITVAWNVELALPDDVGGSICDLEVAPDGTVVVLVAGELPAFVELDSSGSHLRTTIVEPAAGEVLTSACADLTIDRDDARWATIAFSLRGGEQASFVVRTSVDGMTTLWPVLQADETSVGIVALAADASGIYAGGYVRPRSSSVEPDEMFAYVGDLHDASVDVWFQQAPRAGTRQLIARAPDRLYALVKEGTIDFGDGRLVALDPSTRSLAWECVVGVYDGRTDDTIDGATGVSTRGVLVARHDGIARYDESPVPSWGYERSQQGVFHSAVAATERWIVGIAQRSPGPNEPFRIDAEVFDLDGRMSCITAVPIAEVIASSPSIPRARVAAAAGDDAVVLAIAHGDERAANDLWIAMLEPPVDGVD